MAPSCALAGSWYTSAAPELAALRRPAGTGRAGPLVLVTEDQPALFQIIGRHLDGDPVAGERFDAILLHLARGVGNYFMPRVELHAIARVGEDFGHQSFELDQLFLSHGVLQNERRLTGSVRAVGFGVRPAFAMQKCDALHPF